MPPKQSPALKGSRGREFASRLPLQLQRLIVQRPIPLAVPSLKPQPSSLKGVSIRS